MRRIIIILTFFVVSISAFATGVFKSGPVFIYETGKTRTTKSFPVSKYSTTSYGLSFGFEHQMTPSLDAWGQISMLLINNLHYGDLDFNKTYSDLRNYAGSHARASKSVLNATSGVSHAFTFGKFVLTPGAGVFVHFATFTMSDNLFHKSTSFELANYGLSLLLDARFKISDILGLGIIVTPEFGIYNSTAVYDSIGNLKGGYSKGFKWSFTLPVVLGVSYMF